MGDADHPPGVGRQREGHAVSQLVPVVVVMKKDDLEYLSKIVENMPPLLTPLQKNLNGWTDESICLGRLTGAFVELLRNGVIDVEVER